MYFPRVYPSPTFVATPFPRILGSGMWYYFLLLFCLGITSLLYNSFLFASIIILSSFANIDLESNNWYHNTDLLQQRYHDEYYFSFFKYPLINYQLAAAQFLFFIHPLKLNGNGFSLLVGFHPKNFVVCFCFCYKVESLFMILLWKENSTLSNFYLI